MTALISLGQWLVLLMWMHEMFVTVTAVHRWIVLNIVTRIRAMKCFQQLFLIDILTGIFNFVCCSVRYIFKKNKWYLRRTFGDVCEKTVIDCNFVKIRGLMLVSLFFASILASFVYTSVLCLVLTSVQYFSLNWGGFVVVLKIKKKLVII